MAFNAVLKAGVKRSMAPPQPKAEAMQTAETRKTQRKQTEDTPLRSSRLCGSLPAGRTGAARDDSARG